jgi:hypothetical protein
MTDSSTQRGEQLHYAHEEKTGEIQFNEHGLKLERESARVWVDAKKKA